MRFAGFAALIAGGASGLGAATAGRLAAGGARVVIADVDEERGQTLAESVGADFIRCDVREEKDVQDAVDRASQAAGEGGLRIAVSCAGMGSRAKTASSRGPHPLPEFRAVIELNLIGTFNVMRLAAFRMLSNSPTDDGERGVLVNTASAAAFEGQIGQLAYSASKAAVAGMTLTAARDLADKGVRVLTIAPGLFDTPLLGRTPAHVREALGGTVPFPARLGQPDEYARLVEAIIENPMLNGAVLRLDGALRMSPR
jgi:3-hydroxyacyl-CoA dehydrogenase / 3-hydroxy-2-methylbutyryl-CoA dehydrogenase